MKHAAFAVSGAAFDADATSEQVYARAGYTDPDPDPNPNPNPNLDPEPNPHPDPNPNPTQVYARAGAPLVAHALRGGRGALFMYGQVSCS